MFPIIFLLFSLLCAGVKTDDVDIKEKMEADGVIPDVIDEAPSAKLTVIYGEVEVDFGKELTPTQVKDQPEVKWDADSDKYYLLSLVDPDMPSRQNPIYRECKHWLIVNIKGNDVSTGEVIMPYRGVGAPKGTGLHRYIFLVFEQTKKLTFDKPEKFNRTMGVRPPHFSTKNFAEKFNLSKPLAGNYFSAQWDPSVEENRKRYKHQDETD